MDIRQKALEAVEDTIVQFCNLCDVERELREAIADAVAVAVLRYAIEAMPNDGEAGARARLHDLLASLASAPPGSVLVSREDAEKALNLEDIAS